MKCGHSNFPHPPVRQVGLRSDLPAIPLSEIGSSSNVLGYFEGNRLCHWNGTDKILISELQGVKLVERGRIPLASATRPTGLHYSSTGPFVAWTQPSSPTAVYCAKLAEPGRRIELRNDLPGLVHFSFGKDGKHLAATTKDWESFRLWNIETGSVVVSQNGPFGDFAFSGGGRVFAVSVLIGPDHETQFYDLDRPGIPPRRVPGKHRSVWLAASPEGRMVVAATHGGLLQLMDPVAGTLLDSIHGHLNSAAGVCFSPDGRRLTSAHGGWDAVKLWDLHTRQELLNLSGHGSLLAIKWSTDGNVILAGEPTAPRTPWQAWSAPSWEEIAAAEAKEKAESKQP